MCLEINLGSFSVTDHSNLQTHTKSSITGSFSSLFLSLFFPFLLVFQGILAHFSALVKKVAFSNQAESFTHKRKNVSARVYLPTRASSKQLYKLKCQTISVRIDRGKVKIKCRAKYK